MTHVMIIQDQELSQVEILVLVILVILVLCAWCIVDKCCGWMSFVSTSIQRGILDETMTNQIDMYYN